MQIKASQTEPNTKLKIVLVESNTPIYTKS